MSENLDELGDQVGLDLSLVEREKKAGAFSIDIVAQDSNADLVVIENQLYRTDHDHLGKLVTYLALVGARTAVWVSPDPRPEHTRAIQFLNETANAAFYLIKVEAIKIDESNPAPLFTVISGPSDKLMEAAAIKNTQKQAQNDYQKYWAYLLQTAKEKTTLHSACSPGTANWISTTAGLPQCFGLGYVLAYGQGRTELYIDAGKGQEEFNKGAFRALLARRATIEGAFGTHLDWEELPEKRACRVCKRLPGSLDLKEEATWPAFTESFIESMVALHASVKKFLKEAENEGAKAQKLAMEKGDTPPAADDDA